MAFALILEGHVHVGCGDSDLVKVVRVMGSWAHMATLYLICGLPGSGKTTIAKEIEQAQGALLLSEDAWMETLFHTGYDDEKRDTVKAVQWEIAARVLELGRDVVLDWGFWSRAERDDFRARARALGVRTVLRFADVPFDVLWARVARRNENLTPGTFHIEETDLRLWEKSFDRPTAEELE